MAKGGIEISSQTEPRPLEVAGEGCARSRRIIGSRLHCRCII
ncbi:hypothetical protein SAMCFNEI73_Ch3546 [Sinorhizobium americanum]|uniref:Uncharacterized protein n=1 Tax=Sinorhizobium americanum TaxID=194963 RepID=A0A1L3LRU5_9HYPH|nr:hypothetical protein SAMCCGM7_Ch3442 [Sinorhizobium americanum CCGM7]APG92797.1 hypothetical protein SAMCFNEI73_Ch3546 [Sinorhizobium americanum]